MESIKGSFIFYKDWAEVIKGLPAEVRLEVYDCVIEYALSGKLTDMKPMAKIAFGFIKQTIDRDTSKYIEVRTKRQEAGKKGSKERWKNMAKDGKNSNSHVNVNVNGNGNVNDNANDSKSGLHPEKKYYLKTDKEKEHTPPANLKGSNLFRKPIIPSFEEVHLNFLQNGGTEQMARSFYDKNEATGWFNRGSPIVNFRNLTYSYIENWKKNENQNGNKYSGSAKAGKGKFEITGTGGY